MKYYSIFSIVLLLHSNNLLYLGTIIDVVNFYILAVNFL